MRKGAWEGRALLRVKILPSLNVARNQKCPAWVRGWLATEHSTLHFTATALQVSYKHDEEHVPRLLHVTHYFSGTELIKKGVSKKVYSLNSSEIVSIKKHNI